MPETWIDEHTGDETIARPDFRANLRADLAKELAAPARRSIPWRAIGWASVAAAAAVTTVVVVSNDDPSGRVVPGDTTQVSTPPTTPSGLRDQLVDVTWVVTTIDGVELVLDPLPSFTLQADGRLVGYDGCNQYGFDLSQPGGWTLDGDTITVDQQVVSTQIACLDVPEPILPVGDGTVVSFDEGSGELTLTSTDGTVYTAVESTGEAPTVEGLVIPAEGGPLLTPAVLATLPLAEGEAPPMVALLPDRIVVLRLEQSGFGLTVLSFDRSGERLPDTALQSVPAGFAGGAFGGPDGTLYLIVNSETENSQNVLSYRLDGDLWQPGASTQVDQNNDGVYSVGGDGLMLGDSLVLAAQDPDELAPDTTWVFGEFERQVVRTNSDGSTIRWDIVEQFENFSIPAATNPFGDGVLFMGNTSGTEEQRYVGILRGEGESEFFRTDGWTLGGVEETMALFVQIADGELRLGILSPGG